MDWPGPMTDRQFEAWDAWLSEEENRPGRVEQVLTLIAQQAHGIPIKWEIPKPPEPAADNPAVPSQWGELPGIMALAGDLSKIRGGDKLAARLEQLKAAEK